MPVVIRTGERAGKMGKTVVRGLADRDQPDFVRSNDRASGMNGEFFGGHNLRILCAVVSEPDKAQTGYFKCAAVLLLEKEGKLPHAVSVFALYGNGRLARIKANTGIAVANGIRLHVPMQAVCAADTNKAGNTQQEGEQRYAKRCRQTPRRLD